MQRKNLKTCTEHSVAPDARARNVSLRSPPFDYSDLRRLGSLDIFWGKIFPPRGNWTDFRSISLENSFPFPLEWTVFPGYEGLGEKELVRLEGEIFDFPPARANFTSSHFFGLKRCLGFSRFSRRNPKGDRKKGTAKICHKLSQDILWHFMTTYDDIWLFMTFYANGTKRRKLS